MNHPSPRSPGGRRAGVPGSRTGLVLDDPSIGLIERWVVSTLDGRAMPPADADAPGSLDGFASARRPTDPGRPPAGDATPSRGQVGWARFRLTRRRGVLIVSLTDQALVKEADLTELAGDLRALVGAGHLRIVLDFSAVERLSSWAAMMLDRAARVCTSDSAGMLKFSGLRADVSAMFAMAGLAPGIAVYPDTSSAAAGAWPDLPELRPLPVSILAALMRAEDARPRRPVGRAGLDAPSPWQRSEDLPAMTGARLIVQDGPSEGKSIAIRGETFLIGRGSDCQLRLGSSRVSRSHASIERRGRRYFLRDLASTNGSRLNGRAVRDREVEIGDGDRLQFGPLTFALSVGEPSNRFEASGAAWSADDEPSGSTEEFAQLDDFESESGLKHEVIEGVLVVTPLALDLDEPAAVDAFRDGLLSLNARRMPKRVVVNLAHLVHLSGRAIGVLVAHHLRLDRSGGALRVCLANPRVALVLEQVKIGMLVDYHPTVEEAVIAAWPERVPDPVASRT